MENVIGKAAMIAFIIIILLAVLRG